MNCPVFNQCNNADIMCQSCIGCVPEDQYETLSDVLELHYRCVGVKKKPHPYTLWKKKQRTIEIKAKKADAPYRAKKKLGQKARRNEATTRRDIIHATKRSGAAFGDGDSRIGEGRIGIDDKLQTKSRSQITLKTAEIDKARSQNCIVIVTNADGRKFAVAELDYFVEAAFEISKLTGIE